MLLCLTQAHEQLMTKLGWSAAAVDWHAQRLRRTVLRAWRGATTAAATGEGAIAPDAASARAGAAARRRSK